MLQINLSNVAVQLNDIESFYDTVAVKGALTNVNDLQWEVEYLGIGLDTDYVRIVDSAKGFYILIWRAAMNDFNQPTQKLTFSSKPLKRMVEALWAGYQFLMQN